MKPGDIVELTADGLADSGAGRGRHGDREVEVEDLAPGERARVTITSVSRHHLVAYAAIDERLGPLSPDRQKPPCPAAGRCGGCVWQHIRYPAQLVYKRRRVERALSGRRVPEVAPAPSETSYRNKATYVLHRSRDGGLIAGARAPRSAEVVDTRGCRVVEPAIDAVAARTATAIEELDLTAGADGPAPALRYLVVRSGSDGQILLGLVTHSGFDSGHLRRLADSVGTAASTVVHAINDETTGAIFGSGPVHVVRGSGFVNERLGSASVAVGIRSFVQVHRIQAQRIYDRVRDWLVGSGARSAVDLYCGLGGFAFTLADAGLDVRAADRSSDADAAHAAAAAMEIGAPIFQRADAAGVATSEPTDAVIVNPPRKGLSAQALRNVLELDPQHIAYVSCGPASLARDLAVLENSGYRVVELELFDLMPGTPHVEVATLLSRPQRRGL